MQKSFKILKYHLKLEFWALKKILISYVFVSEVGLIPVQPGLNPVQGGPIVVHPGLDSVLSRVSSTETIRGPINTRYVAFIRANHLQQF